MFPARAVAAGCLFVVMEERGLELGSGEEWLRSVSGGKVEWEDFEEVVAEVRKL